MEKINDYKIARADYKATSEDILHVLQEAFGSDVLYLDSDDMISLAENYSMEQTLDVIKAFGQELSSAHLLYTIEDNSDSYVMTIIPRDEEEAFAGKMKELKRKAKCMLQPGKKAGSPAKRFDFGKQLKGNILRWNPDPLILSFPFDGMYYSLPKSEFFYFDPQPVAVQTTPRIILCLAQKDGHYAACYKNPRKESAGKGPADQASYIAVGNSLEDISEWETICKLEYDEHHPGINRICDCIWYGCDLFLATVNRVFRIENAMNGGSDLITVLEFPVDNSLSSCLFTVNGSLFVLIQGKIFEWSKEEGFKNNVFEMESSPLGPGRVFVINDEEVVFADPKQFARSSEIQKRSLIIVNIKTREVRKAECFKGGIKPLEKGKIIVLCSGHDMVKNKKDLPLMVIMDLNTGEQKYLPYGCLGASEIEDVYFTRDNDLLLKTDKGIIYPENLDAFLCE